MASQCQILRLVGTINQVLLKNWMLIAFVFCVLQGRTYTRIVVSMSACEQGLDLGHGAGGFSILSQRRYDRR